MTTTQTKDLAGRSCRVVIPVSTCPSRSVARNDNNKGLTTAYLKVRPFKAACRRLFSSLSRRVLDEQDLVAHLAVHQLVHDALCQQDAVSAGAHAQLVPVFDMSGGIA